jgi:predicted aldo/keto reductase-like oxidoreductase
MHPFVKSALKGLPREELFLQTKIRGKNAKKVRETLDRFRKELGTDYFDSVLIHCARKADWPEHFKRMRDDLSDAKQRKIILAHGLSCHGLAPLQASSECDWGDISLVRINPTGKLVDGPEGAWDEQGDVNAAVGHIRKLHDSGKGVIGMKIYGEGSFQSEAERARSIRFVLGLGCVDVMVIGFAQPEQIDETIRHIGAALDRKAGAT